MSAVGCGAQVGVRKASHWTNPEPEVVLTVNSTVRICRVTLGNDVNMRDVEGRSALLPGKAKDNNGAATIGPFIRLFDDGFTLHYVKSLRVGLQITGPDGFTLSDHSNMSQISRASDDLARQMLNDSHHCPDGAMLFPGTMFAPTKDRGAKGLGFTHASGDGVTISSPLLGRLVNEVQPCDRSEARRFGTRALMHNLAQRGAFGMIDARRRLRSQDWFDNPDHTDMTALYLEQFMNYGLTPEELREGRQIIGIA